MPPELAIPARTRPAWPAAGPWRDGLIRLGGAWLMLLVLFAHDWRAMADQWWNSSTYNHIVLVPLILGWLTWQRLPELRKLAPVCWWPGLVVVCGAVVLWVLGAFAGFDLVRQAGAVALLPASAVLLLGPRVAMGLLFPLCYMAFLVPFGDELIPPLQSVTAWLTVALVDLSGIPAHVDGVFIDTPAGLFEVAEACSGVKFLIAMVALGVLVANVCFRSPLRRAAFLALCIAAPILANGVRAFATIYIAQFVGAERAGGIDHIIYGWVFFALVIALVLGVGWRFFDRGIDDPLTDADALLRAAWLDRLERARLAPLAAILGLGLASLGGHAWAQAAARLSAPLPARLDLPVVPGWTRTDYAPQVWWEPRASGAEHRLLGRYVDAQGRTVDVFFALYASQADGKEAGGFGEGAVRPGTSWAWAAAGPAVAGGRADRLLADGRFGRIAETYYRSNDLLTGSNARLKLAIIADRLLLRARPTAMAILSAEARPGQDPQAALAAFRQSTGPVGEWMDHAARPR